MTQRDRRPERTQIYSFLVLGGILVAAAFASAAYFGPTTREAWAAANILHVLGGAYAFFFSRELFRMLYPEYQTALPKSRGARMGSVLGMV